MQINKHKPEGVVRSYTIWLSANDTHAWAHRYESWPCSQLSGHRCTVSVDLNGLYDFTFDGKHNIDIDATELSAIVEDHLPSDCKHLWPCWKKSL